MNHYMDYVCRGIVRSEDANRCLNKRVVKLSKCNKQLSTAGICMGVSGLLTLSVLWAQDNEIKALRKQVEEIAAARGPMENVVNETEENTQQEGA